MRILSGIQPSGSLHIGNYFGMMKPMIEYQEVDELYCFIVNYHAMTSVTDGRQLAKGTVDAAMDFLALGLDPAQAIFWVQSDVPEVAELTWILSNVTPVGLLLRSHSYKDKIAQGLSPNHGLLSYPVLMAADILLYQSEKVPVGQDQQQHLEIARDIAIKFNHLFGETFVIPEAEINPNIPTVLGLDGRKMSKSYSNSIYLSDEPETVEKKMLTMVTDTARKRKDDPGNPEVCPFYETFHALYSDAETIEWVKLGCTNAEFGCIECKRSVVPKVLDFLGPIREKRHELKENPKMLSDILLEGEKKATLVAAETMLEVRAAMGLDIQT